MEDDSNDLLIAAIKHSINSFNLKNALFLAERLFAQSNSRRLETSAFLLAKVHYLLGNHKQCKYLLDSCSTDSNTILLYGASCLELDSWQEGEIALRRWVEQDKAKLKLSTEQSNDLNLSAIYFMLGNICKKVSRLQQAADAFLKCLELDPLNFTAFQSLCDIGKYQANDRYTWLKANQTRSAPRKFIRLDFSPKIIAFLGKRVIRIYTLSVEK